MNAILQRVLQNKHTSIAGAVYCGSIFAVRFAKIWWPGHDVQLDQTEQLIQGASVGYGLLMAGDGKQTNQQEGK